MAEELDQAGLDWQGAVPVSRRFADPYFSIADGLAETRYVFLEGTDLPKRWRGAQEAHLAELGFGTGLNMLAARELWRRIAAPGGRLIITSFEAYPISRAELARALAPWPELDPGPLIAAWPLSTPLDLGDIRVEIIPGDARRTVPAWPGTAETWFLDGFAPARNPEMWEPALLAAVFARTTPGGHAATYTAAGHVRRALDQAGFVVERRPGFAGKRHMTAAKRPPERA